MAEQMTAILHSDTNNPGVLGQMIAAFMQQWIAERDQSKLYRWQGFRVSRLQDTSGWLAQVDVEITDKSGNGAGGGRA